MATLTERDKVRLSKLPKRLRPFIGPQGVAGKQGELGPKGNTGAGTPGKLGSQGKSGPKGETGSKGEPGDKGDTGSQGATGEKGTEGEQGSKGSTGEKGVKGTKGAAGTAGVKSDKGEVGERGRDGLDGFDGKPGRPGDKGDRGDPGVRGERGFRGDEGPPGERSKELSKKDRERILNEIARTLPFPGPGVAISPRANKPRAVAETFSTMQRDAVLPDNGTIIYNSTDARLQALVDGIWVNLGRPALVTKTSSYTATDADDIIICDALTRAIKITLPTAVGRKGKVFNIKKVDASDNTVTVDGKSAETIDDGLTAVLTVQYEAITVVSNNEEWWIL